MIDYCDIHVYHESQDANDDGIPDECGSPTCRADWDDNGLIEPADTSLFVSQWYEDLGNPTQPQTWRTDFNFNLWIQPSDVALFMANWFANLATGC